MAAIRLSSHSKDRASVAAPLYRPQAGRRQAGRARDSLVGHILEVTRLFETDALCGGSAYPALPLPPRFRERALAARRPARTKTKGGLAHPVRAQTRSPLGVGDQEPNPANTCPAIDRKDDRSSSTFAPNGAPTSRICCRGRRIRNVSDRAGVAELSKPSSSQVWARVVAISRARKRSRSCHEPWDAIRQAESSSPMALASRRRNVSDEPGSAR